VVYIPANPPSPVPEEAEEENGSLDSDVDHEVDRPSTPNAVILLLLLNAVSSDAVLVPGDDWFLPLLFRHQSMEIHLDPNLYLMR
jgi:hypothetical protein